MMHAAIHKGTATMFSVIIPEGWYKTLIFIVVAPVMGMVLGLGFVVAAHWILQHKPPQVVDKWFRKLQLLSAAAYSLGHGGNDAQKTMGTVAGALYTAGFMSKSDMLANWGRFRWPIILAAHAVNRGEVPAWDNRPDGDFFFVPAKTDEEALNAIRRLVVEPQPAIRTRRPGIERRCRCAYGEASDRVVGLSGLT